MSTPLDLMMTGEQLREDYKRRWAETLIEKNALAERVADALRKLDTIAPASFLAKSGAERLALHEAKAILRDAP